MREVYVVGLRERMPFGRVTPRVLKVLSSSLLGAQKLPLHGYHTVR